MAKTLTLQRRNKKRILHGLFSRHVT